MYAFTTSLTLLTSATNVYLTIKYEIHHHARCVLHYFLSFLLLRCKQHLLTSTTTNNIKRTSVTIYIDKKKCDCQRENCVCEFKCNINKFKFIACYSVKLSEGANVCRVELGFSEVKSCDYPHSLCHWITAILHEF